MLRRFLQYLFSPEPSLEGRSPAWSRERAAWLADHPECEACGGTDHITVHHIKPFHMRPELELDRKNFATLCEHPTHNCHFIFGHFLNWSLWNPSVRIDAAEYRRGLEAARKRAG